MTEDTVLITKNMGGGTKEIPLLQDSILTEWSLYPRLFQDFHNNGLEIETYEILDLLDREFQKTTFTRRGSERLELAGNTYDALVLDAINQRIGGKTRIWIDKNTGMMLKTETPNRQTTTLTDKSVKPEIRRLNADTLILAKAGILIRNFQNISYLKVKATLNPIGQWITPESLNIRGQSFSGTVENNRIEGIFEISHQRYNGENPPPFPADYSRDQDLQPFLLPEDFIESDDPVLINKAKELTAGARDSWDAAKRLVEMGG